MSCPSLQAVPLDVTGTIRPGCVHLSLQFTMRNAEDHDVACETFGRNLVAGITRGGSMPWCRFDTDIFLPDAVVRVSLLCRLWVALTSTPGPE